MKALVIGGGGFVGGYLAEHLINDLAWSVCITKMPSDKFYNSNCTIYDLNILNRMDIIYLLKKVQPDYIFHLAAQSSVATSWQNPNLTVDVNINGCINLLESVKELKLNSRILLIGSAEEYGKINNENGLINESQIVAPCNIYAVTKACQNMIGKIYFEAYNLDIIMVRAFNHFGPKQSPNFVISDFCKQVAEIENKLKEPVIKVGNLTAQRDFTDVRDVVKAYSSLMQKGKSGDTYNVGSGQAIEINRILELILSMTDVRIDIEQDKNKFRPVDIKIIKADISKISNTTGWQPKINIKTTIEDTLNYWRQCVRS